MEGGGGVRKVTANEGKSSEYYRVLGGIKYIFFCDTTDLRRQISD